MTGVGQYKVLAVDDDPEQLYTLVELLESAGFDVIQAANGSQAVDSARKLSPDLILMDVNMPLLSGLEATTQLKADSHCRTIPIVLLTSQDTPEQIRDGLRAGADDYISKPIRKAELLGRIHAALRTGRLIRKVAELQRSAENQSAGEIIASSPSMLELLSRVDSAEKSNIPILITGETGTGKELIAQRIHRNSKRSSRPFCAVNCATFQSDLLRSELFGHVKGAFTGAVGDHRGLFESANGGTIFLDEIGEMDRELQAQLLRVLENGTFQPLGSTETRASDVRLVAATHRDLDQMVKDGTFREDLLYRIQVLELSIPPLRERREDILPLCHYFLRRAALELKVPGPALSSEAEELLSNYSWPGNVRQVKNEMYRVVALAESSEIASPSLLSSKVRKGDTLQEEEDRDSPPIAADSKGTDLDMKAAVQKLETRYIQRALTYCDGNKSEAARRLGISRSSLISKIKDYQIV